MVEIAICLAIIGFALIAIIGVLPIGMNTQRDNREETVINQDATVFIEAIRNGARGLDDLTNYVYLITNNWTLYNPDGTPKNSGANGYTYLNSSAPPGTPYHPSSPINNGTNIIGLLSTPEYMDISGLPIPTLMKGGYSNHVVAYVRSISGPAVEKPPQDNQIIQADAFGYRVLCVNAPVAVDTNIFTLPPANPGYLYNQQLTANLHELRLTFLWPQLPNGNLGSSRQTFRTMVAGQIVTNIVAGQVLYFYQSQSFINVTNAL
jgi:type II secretory pathway pseudopilin PulG